jgi:deoxyribodipyrimidine photo-lyase
MLAYICSRDLPFESITDLSDVYTTFRKSLKPLRDCPRTPLPSPTELPPLVEGSLIPPQKSPFSIPNSLAGILKCIMRPLESSPDLIVPPTWPDDNSSDGINTCSAHPFDGGETLAHKRVDNLLVSGTINGYKDTRDGLLGLNNSTKLSAYLAHGCITARQIHTDMFLFETGDSGIELYAASELQRDKLKRWRIADGFGQGESKGTAGVRNELLWRDYFRLVARKYGARLFFLRGIRGSADREWKRIEHNNSSDDQAMTTRSHFRRFCSGRTGISFVDASQREIYLTGYTSNRARQNVASFLAKHLDIDWRLGAEWYESMLVDYDVANNWGNWQYVAGVGNDPREGRLFNPIKQALDYDKEGTYITMWIPELRGLKLYMEEKPGVINEEKQLGLFQPWRLSEADRQALGLNGVDYVDSPLIKIPFRIGWKPRRRGKDSGRGGSSHGRGRGKWRGGSDRNMEQQRSSQG